MRVDVRICAAIVLAALALPVACVAQKFQNPTPEELQMTADPKAPGAPAVFLYREEVTDNFNHFVSEYARIKVLTQQGSKWASVVIPYAGDGVLPRIEGRTIHADGTVIPLSIKPEDIASTAHHPGPSTFTLPGVEVGSILEYRWTVPLGDAKVTGVTPGMQEFINSALASAIPYWDVQQDIFIHKEHFYYNPLGDLERNVIGNQSITRVVDGESASYLLFAAHLPAGAQVQPSPKRDFALDIQDVPPLAHESDAPPAQSMAYRVRFYYTPYLSADVYWADEGKRWAKMIDRAAEPTADLKAAAAQITAGAATDDEKARKLYDAVQALNNTAFSSSESERMQSGILRDVRPAQQVWSAKNGSRNEIATLYLALARAAGLQAGAMSVADRSRRVFDPGYLSFSQLTVNLVVLHINGNDVVVDPGEKLLPYGQLHWSHTLCGGLLETANGVSPNGMTPQNLTKDSILAHTADLTLDAQGGVKGTVKLIMNGPEALYWRQLNLTEGTPAVQKGLSDAISGLLPQGVSGQVQQLQGLDTPTGYLSASVAITGQLGAPAGKTLQVPAFFFSTGSLPRYATEEKRESPLDLHFTEQVIDDVVYHLPANYAVQSAPQPAQLPWAGHAALVVKMEQSPGTINIKHIFARAFVLLEPKDYPSLRDYYQKIAVNDQQHIVLAPGTGAAAGN
jgi:hypothetical protein